MPPIITPVSLVSKPQNKKIVFDDDGEVLAEGSRQKIKKKLKNDQPAETKKKDETTAPEEEDYFAKREKIRKKQKENINENDAEKKWFQVYPQFPSDEEVLDMKENEQLDLYNLCKSSFEAQKSTFLKRNPSDARWLQTALHKGTAKDRANAGALLVTSNPLGNLEALTTLISFSKTSNKSSSEVIGILTELWKEVLLPTHRKLVSLQMRGVDWKSVRKDRTLSKDNQKLIYAYWYFENELKELYFEFLKNLQHGIQTGQENNKTSSIVAASQLLAFAPEKEQMLLAMLINKLGDPVAKVASKALHHLTEVAHKHPNMCGVIVGEAEKLLFRNNISERAQHFTLCFLASIAPAGRPEVCSKLVIICFAFFKVLVQKGAVNNRTMQAILRCLQKAIIEAKPVNGSTEILNKEMQDTIYRLVHLADIRISVQTLGLLLQLITVKTEKSDRFYNALYKKLLDMEVTTIGVKTAAQLLHIVHRAIHIDANLPRAQAFIKRLLQVSLYMPSHLAAGCLIVIYKILRSRKELLTVGNAADMQRNPNIPVVSANDEELSKFDSDGEEKYEDVKDEKDEEEEKVREVKEAEVQAVTMSSWHHANLKTDSANDSKVREIGASKYDPYHRVPSFAGAEFAVRNELLLLREHVHPTVQVFADSILNHKRIDYYGDPLRDFGLPHFLERFAFKNPKKLDNKNTEAPVIAHKRYVSFGSRGKSVKSLTKANCTEDEMFIFNYLEQKRKQVVVDKSKKSSDIDDNAELALKPGEVDDDEFEEYLDGYFGKKGRKAEEFEDDEEMDFLKELGGELKVDASKQKKKKKKSGDSEDESDGENIEADWGDDDVNDDNDDLEDTEMAFNDEESELSSDEEGSDKNDDDDDDESISLDDTSDDNISDAEDNSSIEDDEELLASKQKKSRKEISGINEKNFAQKLKHSDDMSSLFAAADDFAELLEETGKTKGQGTINAVFNKDKSSDKQLKWEEKRKSNAKTYIGRKKSRVGMMAQPSTKKRKR